MWVMSSSSPSPRVRPIDQRVAGAGPSAPGWESTAMTAGTDSTERATTPSGDPIMTAKFLVPAVKAPVVPRPRLFEHLTAGVRGPLTLVSAPAGSGKTVLASTWATSGRAPGPVVWISLDE